MLLTVFTFRDQMQRLEAYFRRRLADDQREEYYARLKDTVDEIFPRAIDRIIETQTVRSFPFVSEIIEAYEWGRAGVVYKEEVREPCDDCSSTGFYLRFDSMGHAWASPCRCSKGRRIWEGWKKRGIDKIIQRQEARFGKPGQDTEPPVEFDPAEAELPAPEPAPKQLPLLTAADPFSMED